MSGKRRGRRVKKVSSSAGNSNDGDGETTPTKTETPPAKKKKRAPLVKVEALLLEKNWAEVRKRLKRVASPKRVGSLLHHTADNPDVPDDIFKLLLSKLKGKREYVCTGGSKPWSIRHEFWGCVCNVNAEDVYSKKIGIVCKNRSPSSLRIFLNEYVNVVGNLHKQSARETIIYLWADYIFPEGNGSYTYSEQKCPKIKQDELISVTSKEDLEESNEVLYSLWEKTELLVKMTKQDGLKKSADGDDDDADDGQFPLIHAMISVEVPRFIVWLALKLYPAQAKVKDDLGRIPLHWATVLNNAKTESSFCVSFEQIDLKETMVELVLDAFPAGAGYTDAKGSHPLALLLDLDYKSWTQNDWTQRCAMALLKQAPEALHETNGENMMLPFMTAACMHEDNTIRASTKREEFVMSLRQLDLTYEILRQDPTAVARGIKDTSRETYLKEQLKEAQSMIQKLEAEKRKLQDEVNMLKNDVNGNNDDHDSVENPSQKRRSKRTRLNHGGSNN